MNWLKRNPELGVVLLLCLASFVAEIWLMQRDQQLAARALAAFEQKKQERGWLARQSPALSQEGEQAIARDVAQARKVLAALRMALQGKSAEQLAAAPARSIDAYFDIAAFVEKARAMAARAQVKIKPGEYFGFASHANEGPEADLVPMVFRQRIAGQYLVENLLESHPRALLAVQREHPLSMAQRNQSGAPTAAGMQSGDFFEFDRQLSLRVPGQMESDAFRLEFTGQTPTLRAFLNNLATFKLPVIVRSVEVEPMTAGPSSAAGLPASAPVPLVAENLSKFAVVVECAALLSRRENPVP